MLQVAISVNKFVASVLLLCLSVFVASQTQRVTTLDGTYKLDDSQSENINTAIDQGVKGLNFLVRHFARSRLKNLNPAYRTVSIASSAREISIVVDGQPALKMPANGSPVVWTSPAGGKTNVKVRFEGVHLLQEFDSSDGHRVNDYTLSTDGRVLSMQVTETSSRLSAPIKYKQVYRRTP
ncbi:MAG: hypothetical protein V7638_3714 [Acidobacteriota bacterium]|jgi:hypothetical protein